MESYIRGTDRKRFKYQIYIIISDNFVIIYFFNLVLLIELINTLPTTLFL